MEHAVPANARPISPSSLAVSIFEQGLGQTGVWVQAMGWVPSGLRVPLGIVRRRGSFIREWTGTSQGVAIYGRCVGAATV